MTQSVKGQYFQGLEFPASNLLQLIKSFIMCYMNNNWIIELDQASLPIFQSLFLRNHRD